MVERKPVTSSVVAAVGYDPEARSLEIELRGGNVYRYHGIPKTFADDFLAAGSLGKFFAQHIKGRFAHVKVV